MPATLQTRPKARSLQTAREARSNGREVGGSQETIRVTVADGHSLVRSAMEALLAEADDIEVVAASANLDETIRHLKGHRPDVLVYDPSHEPDVHIDTETMGALTEASSGTAIVILSSSNDADDARLALRSGAAGFVAKSQDPGDLLQAVRSAAHGEPYINGRLAIDIARLEAAEEADGLTERETEILRLIALGHTNAEIAEMLFLSIRTVESHRAHILEKLRLGSRAELVRYAIDRRLIP